ncbi:hypothetical protein M409DRAFT_68205 [Zasmidium cellare ATCC 36951]|uniref:Uncharacterized protein n=1 Tax=Zasmidium cellare ATCC 36951 TaxID=1080233 RepID=A0A6A6CAY6_ZASCE|nr:uncharacterized protein M409DRAFT_68205 [Zasmidium cellare ATCC 36951]KAF2163963.1 hypothetical protein M409DRAFT_68205 [Zasmidium cellare ATCC 36951]
MKQTQLAWVIEQPGTKSQNESSLYNENGLRSRRFHHKSRKGCKGCKQRRVKVEPRRTDENDNGGITWDPIITARIMEVLIESNAPCTELEKTAVYKRNHAFDVIDHFAACQDSWLGSPTCQRIFQEHGVRLALNAGHLVHAIIAISAAHLAERQTSPKERKKFWIASTLHYHHSLSMYSSAIVHDLQEQDADAIFACGLLHAMLAFIKTPKASEHVALEDDNGPTWIMSMRGIRTLLDTAGLRQRLENGIWLPLIQEFDQWRNTGVDDLSHSGSQQGSCTINSFGDLCDPEPTSPYIAETDMQLAMLDKLFHPNATYHNITGFLAFIADATPQFINRLRADEEEALLVLAHWCALFSRFDQWWISESATIECTRICAHLDKSNNSRIRALLSFPAKACGYELETMALDL